MYSSTSTSSLNTNHLNDLTHPLLPTPWTSLWPLCLSYPQDQVPSSNYCGPCHLQVNLCWRYLSGLSQVKRTLSTCLISTSKLYPVNLICAAQSYTMLRFMFIAYMTISGTQKSAV